jgi:hypothetical protein
MDVIVIPNRSTLHVRAVVRSGAAPDRLDPQHVAA